MRNEYNDLPLQTKIDELMTFWKKKARPKYDRSFAKRLTWNIMLRMALIMLLPVFLLFWLGYAIVHFGGGALCDRLLAGDYETIRRVTSDLYVAATNTAPVIAENLDKPDKLQPIMDRLLKLNPYIRSCGVSFRENYYPEKGRWFCPYAVRHGKTLTAAMTLGGSGFDYLEADWFQEALSRKEGFWGQVYIDTFDCNTPVVSYLLPIRDSRDSTVAVLGVDMSMNWLKEKIEIKFDEDRKDSEDNKDDEWDSEDEVYNFLVDDTGLILLHPDMQRMGRKHIQDYAADLPDNIMKNLLALNKNNVENVMLEDERVWMFYRPVKYTNWSLVMVVPSLIFEGSGCVLGGLSIMIIVIGLLVVYVSGRYAIKRVVRPLRSLATSADEVAKGNFDTVLPYVNSHDEVHQLRDSFENMQHSLTSYVDELKKTTMQKASIESELNIAHGIQMSMLPKTFPPYPERTDIDIFGQLTPAKAVGGDLFDFYLHDEHLFFCIGDVSGKGVPASLVMAVTRTLFRNVSSYIFKPDLIVEAINSTMSVGNELSMFVTMFVGVLDLKTGLLEYCNAGHDSPLMIGQGVELLPCDANLPIGVMEEWQFTLQQATIEHGTTIFLYTDGLNEAENIRHEQFGDERIMALAKKQLAKNGHQPACMIGEMTTAVQQFVGDAEHSDDLTMLAIEYKGGADGADPTCGSNKATDCSGSAGGASGS